jgi:hypothetical protein
VARQRGLEQQITDEFGELVGALGWKDFEAMRFFQRTLEAKPRAKMTDEQ